MTLASQLQTGLTWNLDEGAVDSSKLTYKKKFTDGSGHDQADMVWHAENQSLGDGVAHYLDLTGLTRTVFGKEIAFDFERIKAIHIVNSSTSDGTLLVGNADYDAWWAPFRTVDDHVVVPPDSPLVLANRKGGW